MSANTIGKRIKERRKELRMTQKTLAEKIGCAEITIRQYEGGTRSPSYAARELLAQALGVDAEYLTGESKYKNNDELQAEVTAKHIEADRVEDMLADIGVISKTDDGKYMQVYRENDQLPMLMNAVEFLNFKQHLTKQIRGSVNDYIDICRNHDQNK